MYIFNVIMYIVCNYIYLCNIPSANKENILLNLNFFFGNPQALVDGFFSSVIVFIIVLFIVKLLYVPENEIN